MIKRPLNTRFNDKVFDEVKTTTIRDKPWPIGRRIILFNWMGLPFRSKQKNVAIVEVVKVNPLEISRVGDEITYLIAGFWTLFPIWQSEGFDSQEDMDSYFRPMLKNGQTIKKSIMLFRLRYKNVKIMKKQSNDSEAGITCTVISLTGNETDAECKDISWQMMCNAHPFEAHAYDPDRFWLFFHAKAPHVTRETMVENLKQCES